jgi:ferric-dicitrate binding protein FerR (iron transport regulator)
MEAENIEYSRLLYIASLIYKEQEKELLAENERLDLDAWINEKEQHADMYAALRDHTMLIDEVKALTEYDTPAATREVFRQLGIQSVRNVSRMRTIRAWTAAAAILLMLAGSVVLFTRKKNTPVPAQMTAIAAGGNKAVLTLGNGRQIVLDSVPNGQLTQQIGATISRQNGQVIYDVIKGSNAVATEYNTITIPKGGQYTVVLPDGSKVMLNAASSLKYPTVFTGNDRTVELSGEGYFEIAKNKLQPFVVKTSHQTVTVLGTTFDVMAYSDEPTERTTLVNGAVQVGVGSQTSVLTPGQQALVDKGNVGITVVDADVDKEIAWTTGSFKFDHTDIHPIMRVIARWYDIEVTYEAPANDTETYTGRISRNLPLSDLATFLENNGIHHFRIEGRKLTVLP